MGKVEPWASMGAASTSCYHTDMLGTTRYMTTPDDGQKERGGATGGGLPTEGATFTAFGERICTLDDSCGPTDPNPRYGYAGAHGYRAQDTAEDPGSDPVPFLHVGHRYYDPAIGRFLQRDPIGIDGGLNVYAYVGNSPTSLVDPSGLFLDIIWDVGVLVYDLIKGNWTDAAFDVGAMLIPGVPAGAQKLAKGAIKGAAKGAKAANCARKLNKAKKAFRENKNFKRWFHKQYKPKTKVPGTKRRNPDLSDEDFLDAWEEWNAMQCG